MCRERREGERKKEERLHIIGLWALSRCILSHKSLVYTSSSLSLPLSVLLYDFFLHLLLSVLWKRVRRSGIEDSTRLGAGRVLESRAWAIST